jgi:signal transduction histidine kinase
MLREELTVALARSPGPEHLELGGRRYATGLADVADSAMPARLCLLLPVETLAAEAHRAARRIALTTLVGILLVTGLGAWVAYGVTRPLRRLAGEAADMAASIEPAPGAGPPAGGPTVALSATSRPLSRRFAETGRPSEVSSLAHSFNQLIARLEAAQQGLDQAARLAAIGQLAASVVHEVRNPLCGIAMNARVLAEEAARRGGQRDPSLDLIAREVERIDLYLKEMLLLAAPPEAAGTAPPATSPAASAGLQEAVAAVAALVAGRCRHTGVGVVQRLPEGNANLAIEATRLRQVLLNLVLNALEAMPEGGTLALAAERTEAGAVRVEVTDTGAGLRLAPGQDPFEPFVTTKPGGCGLGLYLSRRLVEQCGGRIGFRTASPHGTTFWFEVPGAEGASAEGKVPLGLTHSRAANGRE